MTRRLEVVCGGLSSAIALLWLVYVVHIVQALNGAIDMTGAPIFNLNMGMIALLCLLSAALILGLSTGAYLHVVHGKRLGALLLWSCAILLIVDLAAYDFAGWGLIPLTTSGPVSPAIWTGTTLPYIMPILEVLATSLAVVAVLASLAPAAGTLVSGKDRLRQGHFPLQGN